jgi:hypothetical protein
MSGACKGRAGGKKVEVSPKMPPGVYTLVVEPEEFFLRSKQEEWIRGQGAFPIRGSAHAIPMQMMHKRLPRVIENHGAPLWKLAANGGLTWIETMRVLRDLPPCGLEPTERRMEEARRQVERMVGNFAETGTW